MTTQIVMLGTGTPVPDPTRFGSCVAIVVDETPYLIDFGPGLVRRATAAFQAGVAGLAPPKLTRAFATHLHSDHTVGYPDLIFTPWVVGRKEPLEVYGPQGIRAMTEHILAAYEQDIHERRFGLEYANDQGHVVNVHEIEAGLVYQDDLVQVEAFPVKHGGWKAFGYKFTTPDRTIVISGDTCPQESVVEHATGCDVLIHEVYTVEGLTRRTEQWQKYHSTVHTSTHELAEIANRAKPGLLILYHQLFWGVPEEDLLQELTERYAGRVVAAKDLDIL